MDIVMLGPRTSHRPLPSNKKSRVFPNLLPPASHGTLSTLEGTSNILLLPWGDSIFLAHCAQGIPRSPSIQRIATFWLLPGERQGAGWFLFGEG